MGIKLNTEQFINKARKLHGNRYIYSKSIYRDNKSKLTITCRNHGDFEQQAGKHMNRGDNCPECAYITRRRSVKKHINTFVEEASLIHDNKYCYSKSNYVNSRTKVVIICPIHGEFEQLPENHLSQKQGCPECGIIQTSKTNMLSTEQFIKKANLIHKYKYDYSKVIYKGNSRHVTILCPEHGPFLQAPNNHVNQRQGCPECSITGFKKELPAILYYLSINKGQAYKIGITNKTLKERFSLSEIKTIEVIKTWHYEVGKEAYNEEQRILRQFKEFQYKGPNLLDCGNTELFTHDVLSLDATIS